MEGKPAINGKDLVGACGIYCGLCMKYQSKAKSRCIGCKLGEQHDWCSIWRCCVKKHGFETCAECGEYPCERYARRRQKDPKGWILPDENLKDIKHGREDWLKEQIERRLLAEKMLENYNEGRSMSFYCKSCTKLPVDLIEEAIGKAEKKFESDGIEKADIKTRAKILKAIIKDSKFR
ncbi:MAG: hypothetical protein A7316_01920 [Candidatus Altiarchaeales archaeon WOR_SM1_86-2]|nr:MAG: hypothetical protein A7315_14790 [Candidatus Altiarchaeales archaeon WOR_SM1_79]ODS37302.1 MAG: hypothetical protein A7316_01920 [Candidatus Altiarchaeales archaeon WOR_SM1_86-2]